MKGSNRIRKRQLRSYYYDKYNRIVDKATAFPVRANSRPHRFVFLIQAFRLPAAKTIKKLLKENGIDPGWWVRAENKRKQNLPF